MDIMWWEIKKIVNGVLCDSTDFTKSITFKIPYNFTAYEAITNTEGCKFWIPDMYCILLCGLSMLYFIVNQQILLYVRPKSDWAHMLWISHYSAH
jgi:hypothetical protein